MQLEQIFQIEDAYEKSFQSILERDGVANVFRSREKRDAQTPFVEVKFLVGEVTEKYQYIIDSTLWIYAAWSGSELQFEVTTHRQNNGAEHKILLGKIRHACQMFRLVIEWPATDAFAGHAIADIREAGSVHTFDSENDFDVTTITFRLLHNLKESALDSATW